LYAVAPVTRRFVGVVGDCRSPPLGLGVGVGPGFGADVDVSGGGGQGDVTDVQLETDLLLTRIDLQNDFAGPVGITGSRRLVRPRQSRKERLPSRPRARNGKEGHRRDRRHQNLFSHVASL
jgi:hypothetical protein